MGVGKLFEKIKGNKKQNEWLFPLLVERLNTSEDAGIQGPETWFSISSISTLCPRAVVMAYRMKIPMVKETSAQSQWTLDRGTAMHSIIQERWLGPMGFLLGGWLCPVCAHTHGEDKSEPPFETYDGPWVTPESSVTMPHECEKCGHKYHPIQPFSYIEPWVYNPHVMVRGRTDGILRLHPASRREFLDIKVTMSLKSVRERPWPNNVSQLNWYMEPSKCRRGRLLYVDPSAKLLENAIVEHVVNFNPETMYREKEMIRGLRETLKDSDKPIPKCPYNGRLPFGDCVCVEMAMFWSNHGSCPSG